MLIVITLFGFTQTIGAIQSGDWFGVLLYGLITLLFTLILKQLYLPEDKS